MEYTPQNAIVLEKYTDSDFETYYSLVSDDQVMAYITGHGLMLDEAREHYASILQVNAAHPELGFFKIFNAAGIYIGEGKLEWCKDSPTQLEVGYILKKNYWGKGYGTMICTRLLTLADTLFPATDVIGIIDPFNAASKKILEKFGFESYFVGIEAGLPTEKLVRRNRL